MKLKSFFPIISQLSNYSKTLFQKDLAAGLTVGIMLIPQGMAYAVIAGLPPIFGLYASTIPLILYALLGTSRQLAVGPVAMVSLLTATGIGSIAEGGTETYIILAITLALLVGMIQFLLGIFRLGFLVNFISHPVISGFTSAAALIIGLSQLKHLLGVAIPRSHLPHEILLNALAQFSNINWITFSIGIVGIILILFIKKYAKSIPGQLVALIFGITIVISFGLASNGVSVVGSIPSGLPLLTMPTFEFNSWQKLFPIAVTIALVSFMESIAVAKAIQSKHKNYEVLPNQELIALGISNIGGSFFQSYPVTGGFSRTAVNDQAGGQTGVSSLVSAALIILTLLFLTPFFYYLPNAILASIIIVAVFGLIDFREAFYLWKSNRRDFWMLFITFFSTLTLGIEIGIGIGVIFSLIMIIYQSTRPHIAILGKVPDSNFYRNIERFPNLKEQHELLIFRFDASLYFANIQYFKDELSTAIDLKGSDLKVVILPFNSINNLDSSAIHALAEVFQNCKEKGIQLYFTGVRGPNRDALKKGNLFEKIGSHNFFMNIQEAVNHFQNLEKKLPNPFSEYLQQTN